MNQHEKQQTPATSNTSVVPFGQKPVSQPGNPADVFDDLAERRLEIAAAGYTISNTGQINGWYALLPGETAMSLDDDRNNFVGFFATEELLIETVEERVETCLAAATERNAVRPGEPVSTNRPEERKTRSEREVIDQTNELARKLYGIRGYSAREGYRFDQATHPHEVEAWQGACAAQILLTDTDPEDALANLEE
jgi:hypothetical protein